jgi:hypothetical protein
MRALWIIFMIGALGDIFPRMGALGTTCIFEERYM